VIAPPTLMLGKANMSVSSPAVYVAVAPSQLSRSVELASAKLYTLRRAA